MIEQSAGEAAGESALQFSVLVAMNDDDTWSAWLSDAPDVSATAPDRDAAVRALVDRLLSRASFSIPG